MKTGAVAFLDILGFKGIWQRQLENQKEEDGLLELINDISQVIIKSYNSPPPSQTWSKTEPPSVTILSDTIVITMSLDSEAIRPDTEGQDCVFQLANVVYFVISHFLEKGLFLRGAIGWGKYSQEGNTFLGPAIDDVAEWYEKANWIGVITTPKTNYIIDKFSPFKVDLNSFRIQMFLKYDVPEKNGNTIRLNAFNWPGYLQAQSNVKPQKNEKSNAYKIMVSNAENLGSGTK